MKTDKKISKVTGPTQTKAPDAEVTPQGSSVTCVPSLKSTAAVGPLKLFALREYQNLFRKQLNETLITLVTKLTGLRLHVLWHQPLDFRRPNELPVLCPQARRRTSLNGRQPECCQSCLQRRWKPVLFRANRGRQFIGQCGVTNFCACFQVDEVCPLTLVLQARVAPHTSQLAPHASHQSVSPAAFHHAVALARLIRHDLESTAQARMAKGELESVSRRLNSTETEAARLRGELSRRLPDLSEPTVQPGLGNHAQKFVDAMRDYVHQHYFHPINLKELASAMKMNASYLSDLFSQTTGVTFHQFLAEARLSKARELLRDPRNRVGEVARAVGYASPDAFRHAFKAHEGLPPAAWRAGQ